MRDSKATPMPAVFFGHGSPMNALEENRHTLAWRQFGQQVARPNGIVCVSAHWYGRGTAVTAMPKPRTIHDFGGFPQALFDVRYPAPGDPALAARVAALLAPVNVRLDENEWGLDHGTWSVLQHVYPGAEIPVVQLSLDAALSPSEHYGLASRLAPLRDEGILVVGLGNIVHNLRALARTHDPLPLDWATRFSAAVRERIVASDHAWLANPEAWGGDGALSVPTPEHYLPLLYILALQRPDDDLVFLTDGIELGSISMLSVVVGALARPLTPRRN